MSFFSSNGVVEKLQGLIPVEQIPVEDIYCAVASVLLSSDIEKTYHLGSQESFFIALGKKMHLIFHNKYHKFSTFYHCIIHQGTFCLKLSHLSPMLAVLTQQDELICRSMLFQHWDLQVLLQEPDAILHDGFSHEDVTCLRKEGELKFSSGWE